MILVFCLLTRKPRASFPSSEQGKVLWEKQQKVKNCLSTWVHSSFPPYLEPYFKEDWETNISGYLERERWSDTMRMINEGTGEGWASTRGDASILATSQESTWRAKKSWHYIYASKSELSQLLRIFSTNKYFSSRSIKDTLLSGLSVGKGFSLTVFLDGSWRYCTKMQPRKPKQS